MPREAYFDCLRGGAIILVVGIHTYVTPWHTTGFEVGLLMRQLLNLAVPLFFALSGYFLALKNFSTQETRNAFWRHQIPKVYVPCMVWSLPSLLFKCREALTPDGFAWGTAVLALLMMLICDYGIFYFIAAIIQCYLIVPFLKANRRWLSVFCLLSMAMIMAASYGRLNTILPMAIYDGNVMMWGMFFYLGYYLSLCHPKYSLWFPLLMAVIAWGLQYAETRWLMTYSGHCVGDKPTSFIFSVAVILLLFHRRMVALYRPNRLTKSLQSVATISFTIYLAHYPIVLLAQHLRQYNALPWVGRWVAVLIVTIIAIELLKRCLPMTVCPFVGLPKPIQTVV